MEKLEYNVETLSSIKDIPVLRQYARRMRDESPEKYEELSGVLKEHAAKIKKQRLDVINEANRLWTDLINDAAEYLEKNSPETLPYLVWSKQGNISGLDLVRLKLDKKFWKKTIGMYLAVHARLLLKIRTRHTDGKVSLSEYLEDAEIDLKTLASETIMRNGKEATDDVSFIINLEETEKAPKKGKKITYVDYDEGESF